MFALARASSNCKRHSSSWQRGCYIRTMTARVHLKKNSGRYSQRALRQDELIGGKPPVSVDLFFRIGVWVEELVRLYRDIVRSLRLWVGVTCIVWFSQ
jgi:hypothetical protein